MAKIRPFKALRPPKHLAEQVAGPPYDVLNSREARILAAENPKSILHINKPEIDLPEDVSLYDDMVYKKGRENLEVFISNGYLVQDDEPYFYIYKQVMGDHQQIGLVAGASVEDYEKDIIKKHEFTRKDKEDDRLKHISTQNAQVGPVFLTYLAQPEIDELIHSYITTHEPEYDFKSKDAFADTHHTFWVVRDKSLNEKLQSLFAQIPYLYVADGHHRSASAMRLKQERQKNNPNHNGSEEYNYFLSVIFPHSQMKILDYNRLIKDLNGASEEEFLSKLRENFVISDSGHSGPHKPEKAHEFGMYLDGKWYRVEAKNQIIDESDPIKKLDVYIMQHFILEPILGISDPRTDKRIDFVGGIRGLKELENRVNNDSWKLAFSMFPTSIEDLMAVADAGKVMPPKSTWFEPKLKSGLAIHLLD